MQAPLSADTARDVEQIQVAQWRRMSPVEKAALVSGLTQAAYEMALAGVGSRFPHASERERFLRLAIDVLGADLACRAYPDASSLMRQK